MQGAFSLARRPSRGTGFLLWLAAGLVVAALALTWAVPVHAPSGVAGMGERPSPAMVKVSRAVSPATFSASLSANTPFAETPANITLTAVITSGASGGSGASYTWDFSCGNGQGGTGTPSQVSYAANYLCSYSSLPAGSSHVDVQVTVSNRTASTTASLTLDIVLGMNSGTISFQPANGYTSTSPPFDFNGSLLIGGGEEPWNISANWGDGSSPYTLTGTSLTSISMGHVYTKAGSFNLTITITDARGYSYTLTQTITVGSGSGTPTGKTGSAGGSGSFLSGTNLYILIGVAVAVVAAVAVLAMRRRSSAGGTPASASPAGDPGPSGPSSSASAAEVPVGDSSASAGMEVGEGVVASAPSVESYHCPICNTELPFADAPCPNCTPSLIPKSSESEPPPSLPGLDEPAFASPQMELPAAAAEGTSPHPAEGGENPPSTPEAAPSAPGHPGDSASPSQDDLFQRLVRSSSPSAPGTDTGVSESVPSTPKPTPNEPPRSSQVARCMVCGGPLQDKFCPTCNMKWD